MGIRDWLRRMFPRETTPPPGTAPTRRAASGGDRDPTAEEIDALRVEPRAKVLDFADLEKLPSGPGFTKLRIGGLPAWADAIAKRRGPEEPIPDSADRVEPRFDERAVLSCSLETKLALGPPVRAAMLEALVHSPAVRLGDGFAEAIVPDALARERTVQDAVLTIARSLTGSDDVVERIVRWMSEDDSVAVRRKCVEWLVHEAPGSERINRAIEAAKERETDDAIRLQLSAAIGIDAADTVEEIAANAEADPELRARALAMLSTIITDEARFDRLLLQALRDDREAVRVSALRVIADHRRTHLGLNVLALLSSGPVFTDCVIALADPKLALAALQGSKKGEAVQISLERIRIASETGGKECVEPLRGFLGAGNPRELATPARNAIEKVKSRLVAVDGGLSVAESDARGHLSPASKGGELSSAAGAGALSETKKKRG